MTIEEVVRKILFHSVNQLLFQMEANEGRGSNITVSLYRFVQRADFPGMETIIPGITTEDVVEWAKVITHFLYVRWGHVVDSLDDLDIINAYQKIIPELYTDLLVDGEILEARLELV